MKYIFNNIVIINFKVPIIKERRRFTDVMEEEAEKSRDARLEAWGRDDYSVYKPKTVTKPSEVAVEVQVIWFLFLDSFDVIDKICCIVAVYL